MRGGVFVFLVAFPWIAGCSGTSEVPLDDLLVRPDEVPERWRLLDLESDDADRLDPSLRGMLEKNPDSFTREQLEAAGWENTQSARLVAFHDGEGILVFASAELDSGRLGEGLAEMCFTGDDVVLVSGRNVAYRVSYRTDDQSLANSALNKVGVRTGAVNGCPGAVGKDVASASNLAFERQYNLTSEGRKTFAFELSRTTELWFEDTHLVQVAVIGHDLRRVADEDAFYEGVTLPPGQYYLRVEPYHDHGSFKVAHGEPETDPF